MDSLLLIASYVMSFAAADSVRVTLVAPAEVRPGAAVPLTLRVENLTTNRVDLYLRGRTITFDVVVARDDGTVVWRRLEGEIIPAVVQVRTLAPGEVLELRTQWDQRTTQGGKAIAGRYALRGLLLTDAPTPLETATTFMQVRNR